MKHRAPFHPFYKTPVCLLGAGLTACLVVACNGAQHSAKGVADTVATATGSAKAGKPAPVNETALRGVRSSPVQNHALAAHLALVGSVAYNPDKVALVGPLVAGRVAVLSARAGSVVHKGELLAEIESPEAGQAMARFITANARSRAAQAQFARERELAEKHISSARELEVAEAQAAEVQAEFWAAEELLQALGLDPSRARGTRRGRVPLRSPIDGVVVDRYVKLGEAVERGTDAFCVADLSSLWVELQIFERDLEHVHVGQEVQLLTESLPGRQFAAKVAFVEPTVDTKTRTTAIRLELDNADHLLHPGQFVTAHVGRGAHANVPQADVLAVERAAVQTLDGKSVVFVAQNGTFEPRHVTLGLHDEHFVEITSGVALGEQVVVEGAFLLKAKRTMR